MTRTLLVFTAFLLLITLACDGVGAADCPCGYTDPSTGAVWTDAIFTYFNETDASTDIVAVPASSPYSDGQNGAGVTGNGTQDWSNIGGQLDKWEDAFGATYRSGVLLNNTQIQNSQLEMYVQPAEMKSRIVYGAEFVTRRRDILYGSFRASMNSTFGRDAGTGFQMSARYNVSETIDIGLFMADQSEDSTLQWSYSAQGTSANPVKLPISTLSGSSVDGFLEHRFDWTSDTILYGNNNTNLSSSTLLVTEDSTHTVPSTPVPISFRHWSDGDPTSSEGPPQHAVQVGRVQYARFFFNSSLSAREEDFVAQCAAASGIGQCSTEDVTLRGSTAFPQAATLAISPAKVHRKAPLYSLIGITVSGGLIVILLLHGLARNYVARRTGHKALATDQNIHDPSSPIEGMNQIPVQHLEGATTFSSYTSDKMNKMEGHGLEESIPRTLSSGVLEKWDPATLARAQLEDDSDDSEIEDDDDDRDDNDDLMENAQQEIDVTNDDGLGRPDRVQFTGHPHSVPTPDGSLPHHYSLDNARRRSSGQMSSYMTGYMTPARVSQPSLVLQQYESGEEDEAGVISKPTPAWNYAALPRRGSRMLPNTFPSPTNQFALGPVNRMSQSSSATEHYRKASRNNSLGDDATDDNNDSCSDMNKKLVSHPFFADYTLDGNFQDFGHSFSIKNRSESLPEEEYKRLRKGSSFTSLALLGNGLGEASPIISVWTRLDNKEKEEDDDQKGDTLAARLDNVEGNVVPTKPWYKKALQYMFVNEGGAALTASGASRVSYLEGLRGFACFLVSFNHFMLMFWYAATTAGAPTHTNGFEVWFYRLITPLLLNQGTKIGIFFVLPARVMGTRYMLRGRLQDLADSTLRRIPRLAFPTFGAVLINYFLIQVDAYKWVPRLASRTWSTWAYFQDYDSVGSFINAWIGLWFTLPPENPVLLTTYATGVLWTIPVITQSSFAILITVIISREIPNVYKRYGFYFLCVLLSWYANRFDYYFICGLVIADMDNKLKYREAAARGIPLVPLSVGKHLPGFMKNGRIHGQIIGWVLFLGGSLVQYLEYDNLPGRSFNSWEHGLLPDLTTSLPRVWEGRSGENYNDPRFSLFAMVVGIFVLCDLCKGFAGFFMLRWWGAIGRNAFSLYLLHGTIFWTWGAWLCLTLLNAGVPYWATITIVFLTSYGLLAIWCEVFTRTFDAWGVSMSKAMWRYSSAGLGRRD
ncbi:hypothetical protein CBS101457_006039 [Exobasidium rhododendri]|nr:hypothetical protein CBS101457_006039 [Exobasidium rhododendri]